jgi:hypothetical protein
MKIADLDCNSTPEVVEIENEGPDAQDLSGWQLVSQPTTDETFDLTPIGSLPAGASVFIESGPSAQATFTWSDAEIFRDDDSTDFVRLIDDAGATRDERACPAEATFSPSPTPSASASPPPTPTVAPAVNVPNGGGPPADVTNLSPSPLVTVVAGGSLVGVGAAILSAAWLGASSRYRRRREPAGSAIEALAPPTIAAPVRRVSRAAPDASRPLLLVLAVAIATAVLVLALSQVTPGHNRK